MTLPRHSADTLYSALLTDTWPDSAAALVDYGLDGDNREQIYAAMQAAVKSGRVTVEQMRNAAGDVEALTRLFGIPISIGW